MGEHLSFLLPFSEGFCRSDSEEQRLYLSERGTGVFVVITVSAGRNNVGEGVIASLGKRGNVILGEVALGTFTTIGTAMIVCNLEFQPLGMREVIDRGIASAGTFALIMFSSFLWMLLFVLLIQLGSLFRMLPTIALTCIPCVLCFFCWMLLGPLSSSGNIGRAITHIMLVDIDASLLGIFEWHGDTSWVMSLGAGVWQPAKTGFRVAIASHERGL